VLHFKRGKTYSFVAIFFKMLLSELVKLFLISKEAQEAVKKNFLEKKVSQIIISVLTSAYFVVQPELSF